MTICGRPFLEGSVKHKIVVRIYDRLSADCSVIVTRQDLIHVWTSHQKAPFISHFQVLQVHSDMRVEEALNDATLARPEVVGPESVLVYEPAKLTTVSAAAGGARERKMPVLRSERHRHR